MMTLWILFCRVTEKVDTLFPFYARDREHAERKAYPGGFRIVMTHLPGRIEEDA